MVDEDYSVTVRDVQVLRGNTAILRYDTIIEFSVFDSLHTVWK